MTSEIVVDPRDLYEVRVADRDSDDEIGDESMPRWVKVFAIIAVVAIAVVVVLHLTGHAPSHGLR